MIFQLFIKVPDPSVIAALPLLLDPGLDIMQLKDTFFLMFSHVEFEVKALGVLLAI